VGGACRDRGRPGHGRHTESAGRGSLRRRRETGAAADQLEEVAAARAEALLHTAVTRDKAERARIELAIRGIDRDDPAGLVTAEEWLAARDDAERAEDPHRQVTDELDLTQVAADRAEAHEDAVRDPRTAATQVPAVDTTRPADEDAAACEPTGAAAAEWEAPATENIAADHTDGLNARRRVPLADRTREQVERARDALRDVAAQHAEDTALEAADTASAPDADREVSDREQAPAVVDDGPVLTRGG
jgi:hypothetical protein